jgi:hypothetical protein
MKAFYVKNRPQGADAIDLIKKVNRVFIGYPPWRVKTKIDITNISQCMLDISVDDSQWNPDKLFKRATGGYRKQVSANRNLSRSIDTGSIVVVPRPEEGICYLAMVQRPFELVDKPTWVFEYAQLRKAQGLDVDDVNHHTGDVVQSWKVTKFKTVPFPHVPRWISYQLLSRNTCGIIHDRMASTTAFDVLDSLYKGNYQPDFTATRDRKKVQDRLLNWISPSSFEHLVCDLLQLEYPTDQWWHTGGSGDGGTDGMAMRGKKITAVMQCKWKYEGDPYQLGDELRDSLRRIWGNNVKVYVAILLSNDNPTSAFQQKRGVEVWDISTIGKMLIKHRKYCVLAKSLGIR